MLSGGLLKWRRLSTLPGFGVSSVSPEWLTRGLAHTIPLVCVSEPTELALQMSHCNMRLRAAKSCRREGSDVYWAFLCPAVGLVVLRDYDGVEPSNIVLLSQHVLKKKKKQPQTYNEDVASAEPFANYVQGLGFCTQHCHTASCTFNP